MLFEAQPRSTIEDGNYVATVTATARETITPRQGKNAGKETPIVRWYWNLDGSTEEVDSITGIDPTSEKSNLFGYLVALVGTDRSKWLSLGEGDLVGKKALIQIVNDADGWPRVTSVTPLPKAMAQPVAPQPIAAEPTPGEAPTDALPF
jgi:hypothetical protein